MNAKAKAVIKAAIKLEVSRVSPLSGHRRQNEQTNWTRQYDPAAQDVRMRLRHMQDLAKAGKREQLASYFTKNRQEILDIIGEWLGHGPAQQIVLGVLNTIADGLRRGDVKPAVQHIPRAIIAIVRESQPL